MQTKNTLRTTSEGAVMIAMAVAFSFVKFSIWPEGGSVDLSMIPLTVFALRHKKAWGMGAGAVFGLLDCILGGGIAYGWQAIILDYIAAYACVGLAGLFADKPVLGTLTGALARFIVHVTSGVVIWGVWMPDEFFGLAMNNVWFYSTFYNATYMVPNAIIAVFAVTALSRATKIFSQ